MKVNNVFNDIYHNRTMRSVMEILAEVGDASHCRRTVLIFIMEVEIILDLANMGVRDDRQRDDIHIFYYSSTQIEKNVRRNDFFVDTIIFFFL